MTDHLQAANLQRRFESLSGKLRDFRTELVALQKKIDRKLAQTLRVLRDLDITFRSKPPDLAFKDKDGEYRTMEAWVDSFVAPLIGYKRRQVFYNLHVARNLVDKVTDDELERMGIEKAKQLSRFAEVKGRVTKELVERALTVESADIFKREIDQAIFKGNPDHEDRSGWATIEIEGPRSYTTRLQNYLQLRRRTEGHKPSDAELLWLAVAVDFEELKQAEEERRAKIAQLPAATKAS